MGQTHTIYEDYVIPAGVMIVIGLEITIEKGCEFWHIPAKAVLTRQIFPPDCIHCIFNQKAKDPMAELVYRNFKLLAVDKFPGGPWRTDL